jgi:WD40 repeat protein
MRLIGLPPSFQGQRIHSLAFLSDGKSLVFATDHEIWFWEEGQFRCRHRYDWVDGMRKSIGLVRISEDCERCAIIICYFEGDSGIDAMIMKFNFRLEMFSVPSFQLENSVENDGGMDGALFSPSGGISVMVSVKGNRYVEHRSLSEQLLGRFTIPEHDTRSENPEFLQEFLPYREGVLFVTTHRFLRYAAPIVVAPPIEAGFSVPELHPELTQKRPEGHTSSTITPDGTYLIVGSREGEVIQWHLDRRRVVHRWNWPVGRVMDLAVSPDGCVAAGAGGKGQLLLWDLE